MGNVYLIKPIIGFIEKIISEKIKILLAYKTN